MHWWRHLAGAELAQSAARDAKFRSHIIRSGRARCPGWWHWEVYDIPAETRKLALSAGAEHSSLLPKGAHEGRTDLGNLAYVGPCPAKGDPPHRYRFTLYALRVTSLPVDRGASGAMVTSVAQEYVIGEGGARVSLWKKAHPALWETQPRDLENSGKASFTESWSRGRSWRRRRHS